MDKLNVLMCIFFSSVTAVNSIHYVDCGSVEATIKKVTVTGCDTQKICPLKQGSNYTVSVDFVTKEQIEKATTVVHGLIAGVPIPFPIDNPDACKDSGLTCPVAKGATASYHSNIYIKTVYPKINVAVKWEVKDQNKKDLVCIVIPVKIEAPAKKSEQKPKLLNQILKKDTSLRFKSNQ